MVCGEKHLMVVAMMSIRHTIKELLLRFLRQLRPMF
jgi:hypothetical protein